MSARSWSTRKFAAPLVTLLALGMLLATALVGTGAEGAAASPGVAAERRTAVAANPVTPGDFTGYGFDQCLAPSQAAMDRWLDTSPFWAVGIYISGYSRACRSQPNLTTTWVSTQLAKGWRLLPITLGPQASCNPRFPRYGTDKTIDPTPGSSGTYYAARKQGMTEGASSVAAATALGIVPGSTLWYDLEGFDTGLTRCRESALWFLSSWSKRVKRLGYVAGVYSSAGAGLDALDDARVNRPNTFQMPDRIWLARWDGEANTSSSYLRSDGWVPGNRVKQYVGGHNETWGGVTINIDRDYLDLGKGSVAVSEKHCAGVQISWGVYPAIHTGTTQSTRVKTLQCLLRERAGYTGPIDGAYSPRLVRAVNAWQSAHGMKVSDWWSRPNWMSLLAVGDRPVLKVGSAGLAVRRLQRTLNASGRAQIPTTGVFDAATQTGLRAWQTAVGADVTGVVSADQWLVLQSGKR